MSNTTLNRLTDEQLAASDLAFTNALADYNEIPGEDNRTIAYLLNHRRARLALFYTVKAVSTVFLATWAITALSFITAVLVPGYWGVFGVSATLGLVALFFAKFWFVPVAKINVTAQSIVTKREIERRAAAQA